MTGTINQGSQAGRGGQGRRRARQPVPRTRTVEFGLSEEEYAVLAQAAGRAGMARTAYAAQAVLTAAANGSPASDQELPGQALTELMRAAGLVHRIAANLHQAVTKLNATGQPAGDLPACATAITRHADHIDEVADAVRKALR
jgi:hypothetical protein